MSERDEIFLKGSGAVFFSGSIHRVCELVWLTKMSKCLFFVLFFKL